MSVDANEWMEAASEGSGITTKELDEHAQAYQAAYAEYEKSKAHTSQLYKEAERLEGKMVEAMELAGKTKYQVDGVGTFYFINKMVVTTPKTNSEKKALFDYIKETHGDDFYLATLSVNHQTLQKLYNTDFEAAKEKNPDDAATFHIPGLQPPTNMRSLGLRGEKK